jgi:P-type Ca2+ transporter type 2C
VSFVPAASLVPGDIVLLEAGDLVAADLRIIASSRLQVNESALTGESAPVGKDPQPVHAAAALPDRRSHLHSGTAVTRGARSALVIAIGMRTELGRIARVVEEAEEEVTPLEKRLEALARRLIALTVAIAVVPVTIGLARGQDLLHWLSMGLALAREKPLLVASAAPASSDSSRCGGGGRDVSLREPHNSAKIAPMDPCISRG